MGECDEMNEFGMQAKVMGFWHDRSLLVFGQG